MTFHGKIYKIKQSRKNLVRPDTSKNICINITTDNIDGEEFFLLEFNESKFFISLQTTKKLGYTLIELADRVNLNITNEVLSK